MAQAQVPQPQFKWVGAIETRSVVSDERALQYGRFVRGAGEYDIDGCRSCGNRLATVAVEVRADAAAQVGSLADVDDLGRRVPEQVATAGARYAFEIYSWGDSA